MFQKSGLFQSMKISLAGLQTQVARLKAVASNLANYKTTGSSPTENPYTRQLVTFKNTLDRTEGIKRVSVKRVVKDKTEYETRHEPGHPAADEKGYVKYPNVNRLVEIMDQREAQRTYESIMGTIDMTRDMIRSTISLIGSGR
jgi:flagellar basal-body rod protein FlgC